MRLIASLDAVPEMPEALSELNFEDCAPETPFGSLTNGNSEVSHNRGNRATETGLVGWGARDRTWEWRIQSPLPYRLATPHLSGVFGGFCVILQLFWAAPRYLSPECSPQAAAGTAGRYSKPSPRRTLAASSPPSRKLIRLGDPLDLESFSPCPSSSSR